MNIWPLIKYITDFSLQLIEPTGPNQYMNTSVQKEKNLDTSQRLLTPASVSRQAGASLPHAECAHPQPCSLPFPGHIIRLYFLAPLEIRCHHVTKWPIEWEQINVYFFLAWSIVIYYVPSPISFP